MDSVIDVIFFDLKDTLGEVYRPGALTVYRPSTEQLLTAMRGPVGVRVGVISNLPKTLTVEQGRKMVEDAGLMPHFDPALIVFNHDAGADKPSPAIYQYAAKLAGVPIERCMYVTENFVEIIGAQVAGMKAQLKPCPPGREFLAETIIGPKTTTDSGRIFERLVEDDHVIGKRVVGATIALCNKLENFDGPRDALPVPAMSLLVYLLTHFIDRFHHRVEEEAIFPLALARGVSPSLIKRTIEEHDLGRAYFKAMDAALQRVETGDLRDTAADFRRCGMGFVELYKRHGPYENDVLLPAIGAVLTPADDVIVTALMRQHMPGDVMPYISIIQMLEREVGI